MEESSLYNEEIFRGVVREVTFEERSEDAEKPRHTDTRRSLSGGGNGGQCPVLKPRPVWPEHGDHWESGGRARAHWPITRFATGDC